MHRERVELLDDVLKVIDKVEESRQTERDKRTELVKSLKVAAENIKNFTVNSHDERLSSLTTNDENAEGKETDGEEQSSYEGRPKKAYLKEASRGSTGEQGG